MRNLFVSGVIIILLSSCNKDDGSTPSGSQPLNYLPLKVGNYWIYQHYDIDTSGNETMTARIDSMVITRDTIIRDKQYFVLEGTDYPFVYPGWNIIDIMRDSSGCLVNHNGTIRFAADNFSDTLAGRILVVGNDTMYTLTYKMEKPYYPVQVPAGLFEVLNYKGTVCTLLNISGVVYPRYLNTYYTNDVGKILSTYFYLHSPEFSEKRLIRYYIQE